MYKGLIGCFTLGLLLASCSKTKPHISVVCEENNVGNSIVKWETTPVLHGTVKIYASTDPDNIPETSPVAMTDIANQRMTVITDNPMRRYYYSLVFNDRYRVKIATRNVNIPGIQNFRDLGGYPSYSTAKTIRWGMLYRSAEIDNVKKYAVEELKNIGIKTLIDLRSPAEIKSDKLQKDFNVVHIPIATGNMKALLAGIRDEEIKSDTVDRIVERINRELVSRYTREYRQAFDVLLNKDNYPIVFYCSSGEGRTSILSALILSALGINEEIIMNDYLLSNSYFNIPAASRYAYHLPARSQEAITTIFSARESFLNAAKEKAEQMYGDIDTYLLKGIGLSKKEIKRLQDILLEKEQ